MTDKMNPAPYRVTTDQEWVAKGYNAAVLYCPLGKDYEVCQCVDEDTAVEIADALNGTELTREERRRRERAAGRTPQF